MQFYSTQKPLHPLHAFSKGDCQTAIFCFFIALITFWYTAMPNIGLGDDGEMATAALHFGVPHPSGYPLWTILGGLFVKIIPFGNGAWKLNLFSGLAASLAVALFALLSRSTMRWLRLEGRLATFFALAASLTFAWSTPIWSQATIGKGTYSLHVLLMLALTTVCYLWIRTPHWKNAFVWVVFSFALGMSNHHMTLAMAALPLLVILLLHKKLFWEYTIYSLLIGSALYLGFAALSNLPDAMKAALRLFYTIVALLFLLVFIQKKLTEWKRGLLLILAVVAGLIPYLYMPIASSTNPPMNWSYTSTRDGFFYAINRSQYWGTLADQLQGTVGKLMGVPPAAKPAAAVQGPGQESHLAAFLGFFRRFWCVLLQNLSPLPLLAVFLALLLIKNQSREQRIWFILLVLGFLLSAFFEPIMAPNGYDNTGWDMQKPWQGLCYGFFLLLASFGITLLVQTTEQYFSGGRYILIALAGAIPFYTFFISLPRSSQRGHWFGWMYGHDMLVDLPPNSFFFGGTDPGRFVPTFMIFGESFEQPQDKRDPHFDRRDLYVVTQNALADLFYNRYIRSQYSNERPSTFNKFEKWLGRDHVYPKEVLLLPHQEEIMSLYQTAMEQFKKNPSGPNPQTNPGTLNSLIAEWIFLHNRDQHHFFVEESFLMPWSYPYAVPHGLCYEISHNPVPVLSAEAVAKDHRFWTDYIANLYAIKEFKNDELAQHSFAKLRNTTGNIYASRGMKQEAEFAYQQALQLWPGNSETIENMSNLLSQQGRYEEARDLLASSLAIDPDNKALQKIQVIILARVKAKNELPQLQQELLIEPNNRPLFGKIIQDLVVLGQQATVDQLINTTIAKGSNEPSLLRDMINFYAIQNRIPEALHVAEALAKNQPDQWDIPFTIAKYNVVLGKLDAAIIALQQAVALGKQTAVQQIMREPIFQQLQQFSSFQKLLQSQQTESTIISQGIMR